ncbi:MAG: signal peptide peptidase SppA [Polyangiales bacterium]|nr:signal peptide peptidase SppA [Sandaracinaceae bacterium]
MLTTPIRAVANVLKAPLYPVYALARRRTPQVGWLHLELRPRLTEFQSALPSLARFVPELAQRQPTALSALRRLAQAASNDPHVLGVLVELPPLATGWSRARGVRDAFRTLRDAGKEVVVYLPRGGGNLELYVAAGASKIILGPEATFMALGLSMESRYIKTMLGKLGVSVEPFARKEFKTAAETAARDAMSEPQREQLGALLTTLHGELVDALAARPAMTPERVDAVFAAGFLRGEAAIAAGVCDAFAYEDQLGETLARLFPSHPRKAAPKAPRWGKGPPKRRSLAPAEPEVALHGAGTFLARAEHEFFYRLRDRPYVGVVRVQGAIRDNDEDPRGIRQTFWALRAAREDDGCVGVVLLVNSPGGSALASDRIHREVVRLKQAKPVVAYFEDVAASGGYYVAAPADAIVAQPVSITGSIGVVSARLLARDLLAKVGVHTEVLRSAPHADMFSPARELDDDERAILDTELDAFYANFVRLVAEGRGRSVDVIEPLARGRVWSGRDAATHGLVDRLGGFDVAFDEVRRRADVPDAQRAGLEPVVLQMRPLVGDGALRRLLVDTDASLTDDLAAVSGAGLPRVAGAVRGLLSPVAPELAELMGLLGGEQFLYYAMGIPDIR